MLKKILPFLMLSLLMAGCTATLTNLTPLQQVRNDNNFYPVDAAFNSKQQSLLWDTIQPYVVVGTNLYPMQPTLVLTNRWEGLIPVPPDKNIVHYFYKFDFRYYDFGIPKSDSARSSQYTLKILEK